MLRPTHFLTGRVRRQAADISRECFNVQFRLSQAVIQRLLRSMIAEFARDVRQREVLRLGRRSTPPGGPKVSQSAY